MIVTGNLNTPNSPELLIVDQDILRDFFAANALNGMLASGMDHYDGTDGKGNNDDAPRFAALAYLYADAMLAQRNQK